MSTTWLCKNRTEKTLREAVSRGNPKCGDPTGAMAALILYRVHDYSSTVLTWEILESSMLWGFIAKSVISAPGRVKQEQEERVEKWLPGCIQSQVVGLAQILSTALPLLTSQHLSTYMLCTRNPYPMFVKYSGLLQHKTLWIQTYSCFLQEKSNHHHHSLLTQLVQNFSRSRYATHDFVISVPKPYLPLTFNRYTAEQVELPH